MDDNSRQAFRKFYHQSLDENGIVGSSFLLVHNNEIAAQEFYGMADRDRRQAVDSETIFHWASITKTFTGVAIMQLRDRGLLKLDDPIVKYIPELRQVHDPFGDVSEITIRHLMSHSAGFRDPTWPWREHDWQPFEPSRWEQLVAMFPYTEISFKPGSKYSYSNLGVIFLGRVVEQLSGDPYQVYVDKNIFKPLEMHHSYFDATPYHLLKNRSHSYYLKDGKVSPGIFDVNTGITVSNGGLNSPLTDMAKYLLFLIGGTRDVTTRAIYDGILKRPSVEEMFTPQIRIEAPDFAQGESNRRDWVGLSFFIEESSGMHLVCHSGSQNGFISHFYLDEKSQTAYIVTFNTDAEGTEKDKRDTRTLDLRLKQYVLKSLFPLFA
jgi:CubicO group peptidase (beta-lactamase class C family)